ncbi:MAG: hypothetical protein Q4C96_08010 [Planctomycetia bacterium]|nr:hypothetical protein [Planctomycetia bacterium]
MIKKIIKFYHFCPEWNILQKIILGVGIFTTSFYGNFTWAADIIQLKNGGEISGWVFGTTSEEKTSKVRMVTRDGIYLTISGDEVTSITRDGQVAEDYEKELKKIQNTVEDHLKIAQWCKENGAASREKAHLSYVLELDPENETAHKKLGHARDVDGKWKSYTERLKDEGLIRVRGKTLTTHQKAQKERKNDIRAEEIRLEKQIALWQKNLGGKSAIKSQEAVDGLNALVSERAIPGLQKAYETEKRVPVKRILVNALARIGNSEAAKTLAILAVDDPSEDIRMWCVRLLREKNDPDVTKYFISRLSPKVSTNPQVNRAAECIAELGDKSAIPSLIEALQTVHKFKYSTGSGSQTSATMTNSPYGGGGGFSFGGGEKIGQSLISNAEVLKALERLTGVNHGYDKNLWKQWFQHQHYDK